MISWTNESKLCKSWEFISRNLTIYFLRISTFSIFNYNAIITPKKSSNFFIIQLPIWKFLQLPLHYFIHVFVQIRIQSRFTYFISLLCLFGIFNLEEFSYPLFFFNFYWRIVALQCFVTFWTLLDVNCSKIFFDSPPRVMKIKTKINKWDLIKPKSFAHQRKL